MSVVEVYVGNIIYRKDNYEGKFFVNDFWIIYGIMFFFY